MTTALFTAARLKFHADLLAHVLTTDARGVPANADRASKSSVKIASSIKRQIELETAAARERMPGQSSGHKFEELCAAFLKTTFLGLQHLRPGDWHVRQVSGHNRNEIAAYEQYAHLAALQRAADRDPELKAALGNDYTVTPDIIITREPEPDTTINAPQIIVDPNVARHAALRRSNNRLPLLHASISCKWTIRSDRSQNSRTEGLNLIKNRKGRLPHVVVVTGEPLPGRLASIAIGTGEIDCVYHFALPELEAAVREEGFDDSAVLLQTMVVGKRLRDISDLPLDLAV